MKTILENPWIIAIVAGLIVTVVGGVILNKILKKKKKETQSFELESDGELEVGKDLVVGDNQDIQSTLSREHKAKLGEDSKTVVKEDFIIGNKKMK
ncbi:MAG: hypothetical protein JW870_05005 [Candidatus Delongbacteria bacterium]|nr:hypothetical protein [Candidatus Delongbacteria bacterium]